MSASAFIDTNVLVYLHDRADPVKRQRARQVVADPHLNLIVSSQILGELYVVLTRKLDPPISPAAAQQIVATWTHHNVISISATMVREACALSADHHVSYFDALVIVAAATAGCERVLTEDLNHGQVIHGVEIVNPFLHSS